MSKPVLVDTGPLFDLADPSDQFHTRARRELARLEAHGYDVAAAYPTICEAYTLVLRRLGGAYAQGWLAEILDGVMAINPEPGDYRVAVRRLMDYPDQAITLFDGVVAALTELLKFPVWTYDRHFDLMGVSRWK